MYCVYCGKEINKNKKFCTACGKNINNHKVNGNNIEEKPDNTKIRSYTIPIGVGVAIVVGFIAIVAREIDISNRINVGKENYESGNYSEVIEDFESVIESGDKNPDNYIILATSYVEVGDLYHARETLKEGYEKTKSEELLNVSIWGPTSAYDIVLSLELTPAIRQEYCFNGDEVKGYQYDKGLILLDKTYFFDEKGTLVGMDISVLDGFSFGGGRMEKLEPYMRNVENHIIDFNYDNYEKEGKVEFIFNGSPYLFFFYEDDVCKMVKEANESEKNALVFNYDDKGRVIGINSAVIHNDKIELSNQEQCEIKYNENNSYVLSLSDSWGRTYTIQYDKEGKELSGELFYHDLQAWQITWEGKKVKNVYRNDELRYTFEYDNNGFLKYAKNCILGLETIGIICDEDGRFTYIHYADGTGEEIKKEITYSEDGKIISEVLENVSIGDITFLDYEYTTDGRLRSVMSKRGQEATAIEFVYDDLGRKIESKYVDLLYIPGTYTGTAEGWEDDIVVQVTVDKTHILSIDIVRHSETVGVGTRAFETIIENVIETNGTDVDTVSGSTITSKNLLNAINNALEQAKITNN